MSSSGPLNCASMDGNNPISAKSVVAFVPLLVGAIAATSVTGQLAGDEKLSLAHMTGAVEPRGDGLRLT